MSSVRTAFPQRCSFCRHTGHNKRTCAGPKRDADFARAIAEWRAFVDVLVANDAAAAAAAEAPVVEAAPAVLDPMETAKADMAERDAADSAAMRAMIPDAAYEARMTAIHDAAVADFRRIDSVVKAAFEARDAATIACDLILRTGTEAERERALDVLAATMRQIQRRCDLDMMPAPGPGLAGLMEPYADL